MTHNNNIILCGFMASGKSRIGAMLAEALKRPLYDIDALIEHDQGQNIKEIFARGGELYFRALELKVIRSLSDVRDAIIVCGGGAPTFFESLQWLKKLGEIFYLDASFSLLLKRLEKSSKRPLGFVQSAADIEHLKQLYLFRKPLYESIAHTIDVNHEQRDKTCAEIIARFNALDKLSTLATIPLYHGFQRSSLYLSSGTIAHLKTIITGLGLDNYRPVLITTTHLRTVLSSFIERIIGQIPLEIITIKDGEAHKNHQTIDDIHERLFKKNYTRKTCVLALGGGIVGDTAGFAAATFMRGIPVIQIPTSLLAMVDSSVGGKTGIDTPFGKNLLGAFHYPKAVVIDTDFLKTLPADEYACGMAEIIKHAIIGDKELFADLEIGLAPLPMIERALRVKMDIIFADPTEQNIRAHLNLGHTYGHALEQLTNYRMKHGQAVAIGLMLAAHLSHRLGLLKEDFRPRLSKLLHKYHLSDTCPKDIDQKALIAAMAHDKKRDNQGLRLILPQALGNVIGHYVNEQDLLPIE